MKAVFEVEVIEKYQAQIKDLNSQNATDAILGLIEENQKNREHVPEIASFFKGEHAFYSKNYEKSLVHYMQARQIEAFEFYCYRATAFVSFTRNNSEKAANFLDKALSIQPDDQPCLDLKEEMQSHNLDQIQENRQDPAPAFTPPKKEEPSSHFIASKLGVDVEAEKELEQRIQAHKETAQTALRKYQEQTPDHPAANENRLFILNGWNRPGPQAIIPRLPSKSGGIFMRWQGHGIVINPGADFLDRFHRAGLHLSLIDSVIVTESHPEAHADIHKIYDLNYELNKVGTDLHIIRYYLNHNAHQKLVHTLKPNFKQERSTVHSLELFLDSPDVEKENLTENIALNYFSTGSRSTISGHDKAHSLAIRLELSKGSETKQIGYVSGAGWTPTLGSHFGRIDLMISGFERTEPNDYGKLNYLDHNLGYFGTYTLMEEVKPALHLVTGFDGKQGDIRLEIVKKMRKEFHNHHPTLSNAPVMLPADRGMEIDLNQMKVASSMNGEMLEPKKVLISKTHDSFGQLSYLSREGVL